MVKYVFKISANNPEEFLNLVAGVFPKESISLRKVLNSSKFFPRYSYEQSTNLTGLAGPQAEISQEPTFIVILPGDIQSYNSPQFDSQDKNKLVLKGSRVQVEAVYEQTSGLLYGVVGAGVLAVIILLIVVIKFKSTARTATIQAAASIEKGSSSMISSVKLMGIKQR